MSREVTKCSDDEVCLSCQIDTLECRVEELEECLELLEEHVATLEAEVKSQADDINELESDNEDKDQEINALSNRIDQLEAEEDIEEDITIDSTNVYDNLVNMYYHEDFSIQEIFKRIGKKAVEVEFQKFLMSQED